MTTRPPSAPQRYQRNCSNGYARYPPRYDRELEELRRVYEYDEQLEEVLFTFTHLSYFLFLNFRML